VKGIYTWRGRRFRLGRSTTPPPDRLRSPSVAEGFSRKPRSFRFCVMLILPS